MDGGMALGVLALCARTQPPFQVATVLSAQGLAGLVRGELAALTAKASRSNRRKSCAAFANAYATKPKNKTTLF
jgi:hypothetical protein